MLYLDSLHATTCKLFWLTLMLHSWNFKVEFVHAYSIVLAGYIIHCQYYHVESELAMLMLSIGPRTRMRATCLRSRHT